MSHANSFSVYLKYKLTASSEIAGMLLVRGNIPVPSKLPSPLLIQLMGLPIISTHFLFCLWVAVLGFAWMNLSWGLKEMKNVCSSPSEQMEI